MSDKSEKYEDQIEKILKDSGDLPEPPPPQPQNPLFEDLKIWIRQSLGRSFGVISPLKLIVLSAVMGILFMVTKFPLFAWLTLVAFLGTYIVFFLGRRSKKPRKNRCGSLTAQRSKSVSHNTKRIAVILRILPHHAPTGTSLFSSSPCNTEVNPD